MRGFPNSRVKAVLVGGAIFAVVGPPIGLVVFLVNSGFFRSRIRSLWSCLPAGLLCFALAFAPLALFGKPGNVGSNLLFFGLPGLVAGMVCAWVIRVRANTSLKPGPLRGAA